MSHTVCLSEHDEREHGLRAAFGSLTSGGDTGALEFMEKENMLLHIGDGYLTPPVDRAARKGEK